MKGNIPMDEQKQLFQAMGRANKIAVNSRRKKELKIWSKITSPYTLKQGLERLTKTELDDIRHNLNLKNLSGLKKENLLQELNNQITSKLDEFLQLLDVERLNYFLEIINHEGVMEVDLSLDKAEYFRGFGIFFTGNIQGKHVLTVPLELIEQFKSFDIKKYLKQARRNTEIIQLTHGLLFYYGILEIYELEKLINGYISEPVKDSYLVKLLFNSMHYYNRIRPSYHIGFCDARIDDSERILNERKNYPLSDFYAFSKSQILEASDPYFVDVTPELETLINFLIAQYKLPQEELGQIALDCIDFIQFGLNPEDILKLLHYEMMLPINSKEIEQELMHNLINLSNSTRLWTLKGYTYNELFQFEKKIPRNIRSLKPNLQFKNDFPAGYRTVVIDFKTRKRIGPEDPCPCGSGLLFYSCCGS
jgi:hypothetical protein